MGGDATTTTARDEELFVKKIPNLINALVPVKWLWRWSQRRFKSNAPGAVAELLNEGIAFGEAPRFRQAERKLYYVDIYAKHVHRYDPETKIDEVVFEHDDYVSGLGWLPDGRLLVVSMKKQQVLAVDLTTKTTTIHGDLCGVVRASANDMVVSASGRAYVGNVGFDYVESKTMYTTTVVRVDPDQSVHVDAKDVFMPNGCVITPDGTTLLVAETLGTKITAFDIQEDGKLTNRRVWANMRCPVDGMCLDAEGCIWVAVPQIGIYKTAGALVRVQEGGEILEILGFGANGITQGVFACQLGTDSDGKHYLYFLEAATSMEHAVLKNGLEEAKKNGVLKRISVPVGPATMASNANYCGGYC